MSWRRDYLRDAWVNGPTTITDEMIRRRPGFARSLAFASTGEPLPEEAFRSAAPPVVPVVVMEAYVRYLLATGREEIEGAEE